MDAGLHVPCIEDSHLGNRQGLDTWMQGKGREDFKDSSVNTEWYAIGYL